MRLRQSDLVVPLLTEAAVSGLPVGIAAANTAASGVVRGGQRRSALGNLCGADERLAVERELLGPLPSLRPRSARRR